MITLDYTKDGELLNKTALKFAESIGGGVKNTQIRKFFDQVLNLNNSAKHCDDFSVDVLPFVKMLNSKVAYASSRQSAGGNLVNKAFVDMINSCVNQIDSKEKLAIFKLFFEAVIGFHKSLEGKR